MELRISKNWLDKHRATDDKYNIGAGNLMLNLGGAQGVDNVDWEHELLEGTRDEVGEKLRLFPVGQRFRLIILPSHENPKVYESALSTHQYTHSRLSLDLVRVSDERSGEYRTESEAQAKHNEDES